LCEISISEKKFVADSKLEKQSRQNLKRKGKKKTPINFPRFLSWFKYEAENMEGCFFLNVISFLPVL
jgi:hypothetical protein